MRWSKCKGALRVLGLAFLIVCYSISVWAAEERLVGGACAYKGYSGRATIVSVSKYEEGRVKDKYKVEFTFSPDKEVQEAFASTDGKTYLMTLTGGAYPGKDLLEKKGVKSGAVFRATMSVITKGTCTPVLFVFPAIQATPMID